jgi:long-subunit acyl-CoA synthetase (AMP-forming)
MSIVLNHLTQRATAGDGSVALSDELCSFTYHELHAEIVKTARVLRDRLRGDGPVAIIADNSCAWVILDLAFVLLKRPLVPLPGFFTADQRQSALARVGAEFLISDAEQPLQSSINIGGRTLSVTELNARPVRLPAGTTKITFTSGTTGEPKGVCLSQAAMEGVSLSLVEAIGKDKAGVHLPILSLAILLENVAGLYTTLLAGGHYRALSQSEIGFVRPFAPDFDKLVDVLGQSRAATAIMVPEILRGMMAALFRLRIRLPELKFLAVGGARVSTSLLETARWLELPVYQGYGLSEAASVVSLNTVENNRPGTVGKPLPHVDLQLAEDGEVLITRPGFLGYVGESPASDLYATGDVGFIDPDGFLAINGRKSNVVITAFGRNVSPEWVESELTASPAILQAYVFGEGSRKLSALIVPTSASAGSESVAAGIGAANARLPDYARIDRWMMVQPFTVEQGLLTPNGRLQRDAISRTYSGALGHLEAPTFYDTLVMETALQQGYLVATEQIRRGLVGDISRKAYLEYLAEAYHHVQHTVPLMQLVKSRLPKGREWLNKALDEYIAEESGHEEWILDDIRNAGGDAEAVRRSRPGMATEFMVSYAYDYINRVNPVGFFGMVFVLEGTSTKLATVGAEALMKSLNLSSECFRYLTSHGSLDIEHMNFFRDLMGRIDHLEDKAAIIHMAQRMFILFANLFRSISIEPASRHAVA